MKIVSSLRAIPSSERVSALLSVTRENFKTSLMRYYSTFSLSNEEPLTSNFRMNRARHGRVDMVYLLHPAARNPEKFDMAAKSISLVLLPC